LHCPVVDALGEHRALDDPLGPGRVRVEIDKVVGARGGWQTLKETVGGLMDAAVPPGTLTRIRELISSIAGGAIEAHDLRSRHAVRRTFIDFHLVVPAGMSVSQPHEICDRIEQVLKAEIDDSPTTIHVEPDDKARHSGIVVL
jgi:divalent metal cation (Fe/Co/Zn/Cd) transporter